MLYAYIYGARALERERERESMSVRDKGNRSEVDQDTLMIYDQIRFIFNIVIPSGHSLLSSVLQCMNPIGNKSQQQICHHHMNFSACEMFSPPSCYFRQKISIYIFSHTHTHIYIYIYIYIYI